MSGPLAGYKILEFEGIGPAPFAGMMLSDMGADVLRIDRPATVRGERTDQSPEISPATRAAVTRRGRRSIGVDLKNPDGVATVLRLVGMADGLIEGYRPGVMERLGVGPDECLAANGRLVYGRMTGWGQGGPLAQAAGHDLNYLAVSGTLSLIAGAGGAPGIPLNLVGDYGGGGLLLAFGVVCGLLEAKGSGKGQVIDAAIVDGAALLAATFWGYHALGTLGERGTNVLDGGAPFYNIYETKDGAYITFGSIEPAFYEQLVAALGLGDVSELPKQNAHDAWPTMKERIAAIVEQKTRAEWTEALEGTDVCFAPVLTLDEVAQHKQVHARQGVVEINGVNQPAPAPRFSRTSPAIERPAPESGQHTDEALREWGFTPDELATLRKAGAIA